MQYAFPLVTYHPVYEHNVDITDVLTPIKLGVYIKNHSGNYALRVLVREDLKAINWSGSYRFAGIITKSI